MPSPLTILGAALVGLLAATLGGFIVGRRYERRLLATSAVVGGVREPIVAASVEVSSDPSPEGMRTGFVRQLPGSGLLFAARLDAAAAWRQTHGQDAVQRLTATLHEALAAAEGVTASVLWSGDSVVVRFEPGDFEAASRSLLAGVRAASFALGDDQPVHATASFGGTAYEAGEAKAAIDRAFEAAEEVSRVGRNQVGHWTGSRIRRLDLD